jgi:hypothetical protein
MNDRQLEASVRAFAAERRYGAAAVERWLRLTDADAAALLELARELRLGENQLRDLWNWAEEIAARDGLALAVVLADDAVRAARRRALGRNDRLKLVKAALRLRRFPQLAAHEERLATLLRALGVPRNVRVVLPEFLEGDTLRVEITADSQAALRHAAARLLEAAAAAACRELFALLGEVP